MGYWLAEKRTAQQSSFIQRFDPRFWTVNFPRPMMASVVTTGPDALRVDATYYNANELAGLIWETEDKWDHPLLAYETRKDFGRLKLSFRWKSSGIMPLDAVNGPTLTIEGRDAAGNAKSWYVRLWNYASGSAEDALISLNFSDMSGGFLLPVEADSVWPHDIDRMFISVIPPEYDASATRFASPREGWVEIKEIRCEGEASMLEIGDVLVPEHKLSMATGYDDSFNQTPERLLRNIRGLGYRGAINHYVGMSHYFRLETNGAGLYASLAGGALNTPCKAWHENMASMAKTMGYGVIFSLSYELFNEHCWNDWKQRAENGDVALTGWVPPSTLLSPAHSGAMGYLRAIARAFVQIAKAANLPVQFQIGEPWWWIMSDRRICLYDSAAQSAFGGLLTSISDVHAPMNGAQQAMMDKAGEILAASTAALAQAAKDEAGVAGAQTMLLVYLPTVLDGEAPEVQRANVPTGWAKPAFDVLQLEDYDWVTEGNIAATDKGVTAMTSRLGYPLAEQHYLSGFVLNAADKAQWRRIDAAASASLQRGTDATFIWALPQVKRDGFTHFYEKEADVRAFDDVQFPVSIGKNASVSPEFSTTVVTTVSGFERRNSDWSDARLSYDAGPGVRLEAELERLIEFFRARRG